MLNSYLILISLLHFVNVILYYRYAESKPLFHMFGEEPDPSLHAKLMAGCEENKEVSFRRN